MSDRAFTLLFLFFQDMMLLIGLACLLAVLFIQWSIDAAHRYAVLARPSDRSSHSVPTPRLGGLGVALSFYIVLLLMYWFPMRYEWFPRMHPTPLNSAIIVGGGYALVGGLLDDILELNARWKLLFQFAPAGLAVLSGFYLEEFELPTGSVVQMSHWLAVGFTLLFIVFTMNAYNFMDGMDGQAPLFGFLATMNLCMLYASSQFWGSTHEIFLLAILAATLAGLLMFNHPGVPQNKKTFMGDSGSQFIGFLLAIFALRTGKTDVGEVSFVAALVTLSPFFWDVCYTLVRRIRRGENILVAHRSHLYQRLLIAGWTHGQVLALNTLLWAYCMFSAQIYRWAMHSGNLSIGWVALGGVACALVGYTLIVLLVEAKQTPS